MKIAGADGRIREITTPASAGGGSATKPFCDGPKKIGSLADAKPSRACDMLDAFHGSGYLIFPAPV